ncbi:hypothetical protein SLS56_011190 [Neofusicoccum ribis]|uniref:Uncharacterized protein n=1 Tax=Neofusicoccum ribis TaxID=45134 RepID=A0ABR3SCB3_9PEZI
MGPLSTEIYRGRANQTLNNVIFVHAFGVDIVCQLWNTSYNIGVHFEKGIQNIVPVSLTYLQAAAFPGDVGRYSDTQRRPGVLPTFFITHLLFSELLVANVSKNTYGSSYESYQADQPVLDSALFACPELANITNLGNGTMQPWMCRNGSVASAIEDLSRNFTYSLLTFSGWAGKYNTSVRALTFEPRNFYSYDAPKLLTAYAVSIFATLGCLGVGFFALRSNGVASSASFSSFLLTTRNSDLDRLADGHHLGTRPLAKDIRQTELQFGQLDAGQASEHVAFGLKGSVKGLAA